MRNDPARVTRSLPQGQGGRKQRPAGSTALAGAHGMNSLLAMTKPAKPSRKVERLRSALRENLKRRKAQAKGREASGLAGEVRPSTPAHDSAGISADKQDR